jgi:hypothetical protein
MFQIITLLSVLVYLWSSFENISLISDVEVYLSVLPWFVTGYTDAEGSFTIGITKSKTHSLGWHVKPKFVIGTLNNPANREFLELFQVFFGGGSIYLGGNQLYFIISDLPTLLRVRDHFLLFP